MSTQEKTVTSPSVTASSSTIDCFFHIAKRGSGITQEVRDNFVAFFAMAYILVVNPIIFSTTLPAEVGFAFAGIATGIALVAGIVAILMSLIVNFPLALTAGMGLNTVIVFTLAGGNGLNYQEAMGLIVWEGTLIMVLILTGFREAVSRAVPRQFKTAISVGIDLLAAFAGLINAGIIHPGGTSVRLGINGFLAGLSTLVFVSGLLLTVVPYTREAKGTVFTGFLSLTILAMIFQAAFHVSAMKDETDEIVNPIGWGQTIPELPGSIVLLPNFGSLFQVDAFGVLSKLSPVIIIPLIFFLMLADFFDMMDTMIVIGDEAKLPDKNGNPLRSREILLVDSFATVTGSVDGVPPNTSYTESSVGVGEGVRTGLVPVVTGLLFLASAFLSPLVALIPTEAAFTVLVFVGFPMMIQVAGIDRSKAEITIPTFLTTVFMPFAYSITVGIGVGFVTYTLIRIAEDQAKRAHPLMWFVSIPSVAHFLLGPIEALIG